MPRKDIYEALKKDHREVLDLLKRADAAKDAHSRGELVERIRQELQAHTEAEQEVFYDRLRSERSARPLVLEAEQEHHVVNILLRELHRMKEDSENFAAKLHVLREIVRHHIEEEEQEIFPEAKKVLEAGEATELAERFEQAKQALA